MKKVHLACINTPLADSTRHWRALCGTDLVLLMLEGGVQVVLGVWVFGQTKNEDYLFIDSQMEWICLVLP